MSPTCCWSRPGPRPGFRSLPWTGAPGLTAEPLTTMDQTRKQARRAFARDARPAVGAEGRGWAAVSRMLDLAAVALAAEQVGGAQRVLDMAVDYAKIRVQFGTADRQFPGHQAQVRRHAPRGRVGPVGGLLCRLGRGAGRRRASGRREPGQVLLLRGLLRTRPPTTSRSTAVSASPGNIRPTCTSSGPRAANCSSVIPPTTANCSRSASASRGLRS